MEQPTKSKTVKKRKKKPVRKKKQVKKTFKPQKYGISKLEQDFARDFLEKNHIKYVYQYEAKDIGRFYDFAVTVYDDYPFKYENKDGLKSIVQPNASFFIGFLLEVDGDWYHSNPKLVNESEMNPMQKHNRMVDKLKDKWAAMHGIPLLRIWEEDIRKRPKEVAKLIKEYINSAKRRRIIVENRKRPH